MTPASSSRTMTPGEWGLLIALSVLWGGSFFFNGVALTALPPLTVVSLRVVLAAGLLVLAVRLAGRQMPADLATWRDFLVMGLLNNVVPFCLIVWGQTRIASGLASILNATTPLATVLVAHLLTGDERLTGPKLVGVLAGLAGVAIMIGPAALEGTGGRDVAGEMACLGAALSYGFAGIYGRRFGARGIPPLVTAAAQVSASSLVLVPLALVVDRPWLLPVPGPAAIGAVLGLATLSTALAYVVFFRILAGAGATNAGLVTFLIPVSAILLGTLVLGERLDPRHFAGMGLIGLGLACIDGRWLRRREPA